MKKMNKKITLGVVTAFTASTMLGLGLGFALNKDQLNQVNIITAHNSYVLGEEEMSAIEYLADIISDKYERNFDDGGEEETPPGGDNPIDRDSSKGIASEWLQIAFYTTALIGVDVTDGWDLEAQEGSIFYDNNEDASWIAPRNSDFEAMLEAFAKMWLFNKSNGSNKMFYELALDLTKEWNLATSAGQFISPDYKTYYDAKENEDAFELLLDDIVNSRKFILEFLEFSYTYSYLWQNSTSRSFDYLFTQELYSAKPALVWTLEFNEFSPENPDSLVNYINDWNDQDYDEIVSNWNDLYIGKGIHDEHYTKINNGEDRIWTLTDFEDASTSTLTGFKGIESRGNNSIWQEEALDSDKIWEQQADGHIVAGEHTTTASIDTQEGTLLIDVDIVQKGDGWDYQVAIVRPLNAFTFAEGYNAVDGTADSWTYTVDAHVNGDDIYIDSQVGTVSYDWFNYITGLDENSDEYMLVFVMLNEMIASASSTTAIRGQSFWRSKGFYIELYGSYHRDYADLIPQGIQK